MARRKKTEDANGSAPNSNYANLPIMATVRKHFENISALKQEVDDARMALAQAYKDAEADGIDRQALKFVAKLLRQDKAKTASFVHHMKHYANALELGQQLDMFAQDEAADAPQPAHA